MLVNNEKRLFLFMRVIALSIGIYGLGGGIFAIMTGGSSMVYGPEDSFLYSNNAIGMAFAMNAPLLFYLAKMERRLWLQRVMWAMLAMSYPATICTFSRGAWIGLTVSTALIALKSKYRVLLIVGGVILGTVLAPSLIALAPDRVVGRFQDLQNYQEEGSAQSRFWTWEFCARVGIGRPLHGGGFDFYNEETYRTYFPEYLTHWTTAIHSCHSMWFTILGEHGIPGIAIWLMLLGSCFLSLRRILSHANAHGEMSWAINYGNMLQAALISYAITGIFLDTAYFDIFYQLVAATVVLKESVAQCGEKLGKQHSGKAVETPYPPRSLIHT
jgi:probable O-glycosylation ligase (exosortase A-associated)